MSRDDGKNETVWVAVEVLHVTENAVLVRQRPDVWVPRSQIRDFEPVGHKEEIGDLEPHDQTKLELPLWLVESKGLDDQVVDP